MCEERPEEIHHDIGGWISGPSLPVPDEGAARLHREHGDRWEIVRAATVWTATRSTHDGRHVRYLVAFTADELADKIAAAEREEP